MWFISMSKTEIKFYSVLRQTSGTEEIESYADWHFKKDYVDMNCFCPHFIFVLDYSVLKYFYASFFLTATLYSFKVYIPQL